MYRPWDLLRNVDAALTSLDRLGSSVSEIKNQDKPRVVIAAPAVFGFITLPKVVGAIRTKTSSSIRVLSGSDEEVREYILFGQADLGISRLPLDPGLFDWAPVATARSACIFHPEHRFSARSHIVAQDLIGEAIIDIDPQFATHQMISTH
ncbi:LysR substrate-binding domain-containing protein [Rhizobium giardinii]|uniref:LysR substrate-binding domain-containing protein n=1 Tax=Rhizobium giardinii TaxID=56731 RepID=UPI003B82F54F